MRKEQNEKEYQHNNTANAPTDMLNIPNTKSGSLENEPDVAKDPKSFLEAPYSFSMANSESVSLNSGGIQITVPDFSLPGRNGFDLSITRCYNSDNANLQEWGPLYWNSWGQDGFSTESRPNEHNLRTYGLGYGWSFALPSIEVVPQRLRQARITYNPFLHLENGQTFTMVDGDNRLEDHPQKDVSVQALNGTIKHPCRSNAAKNYTTVVSYKNGNKDYFQQKYDNSGLVGYNLVARMDMYGNTIFFTIQDYGGMHIIDTFGRDIHLIKSGNHLTWNLPDGKEIVYTIEELGGRKLMRVRDQVGRFAKYEYYDPEIYKGNVKFATESQGDYSRVSIQYMLLKSFTHPTGAVTSYEYGLGTKENPTAFRYIVGDLEGFRETFPLRRRYDSYSNKNYNEGRYSYTISPDGKFICKTTVQLPEDVIERHTFNDKSRVTYKEIRHDGILASSNDYEYGTDPAANNYKLPTYERSRQYSLQDSGIYLEKITRWHYDGGMFGNIVRLVEEYPFDTPLNQETTMQYGAHNILTEKTYKKDNDTTIAERYTLRQHPNDKVVEYKRIYENNKLKQKTRYLYGTRSEHAYCVLQEDRYYTEDLWENLEASSLSNTTYYMYDDTQFTHQPISTKIRKIKNVDGTAADPIIERFSYDAWGRVIQKTDASGNATNYIYDGLGRVVQEIYPPVNGVRYQKTTHYEDALNIITATDENGWVTQYHYTPLGKIENVQITKSEAPTPHTYDTPYILQQQSEYDSLERPVCEKVFNENGSVRCTTRYQYDTFGRILQKRIEETGYEENYQYTNAIVEPTWSSRCSMQQKTVVGENSITNITTRTYTNQAGNQISEYLGGELTARYSYDKMGNKINHYDGRGNGKGFQYNWAGQVESWYMYTESNGTVRGTTEYDALGQKHHEIDELGNYTYYYYDSAGRLLRQVTPFDDNQNAETRFKYDAAGNLVLQSVYTGQYWRESASTYDALGRQTSATQLGNEHNGWNRTEYEYDGVGNRTKMHAGITFYSQHGARQGPVCHTTTYTYNRYGDATKMVDAMGQTESYDYDLMGTLRTKTDRNGNTIHYKYDAMDRLIERHGTVRHGQHITKSIYTCRYTRLGQKAEEKTQEERDGHLEEPVVLNYYYNKKGQRYSTRCSSEMGFLKQSTFDANGNRTEFKVQQGRGFVLELWYNYDEANRLTHVWNTPPVPIVKGEAPPKGLLTVYEYNAKGLRTKVTRPQTGLETMYDYNKAGLITVLSNCQGLKVRSQFEYAYSPDGNMINRKDNDGEASFVYDGYGRLVEEAYTGWQTIQYTYDAYQNRKTMQVSYPPSRPQAGYTTTYIYDDNNRLLTEVKASKKGTETFTYEYDSNGNQTRREWQKNHRRAPGVKPPHMGFTEKKMTPTILDTRCYNVFNQLVSVWADTTQVNYIYRPDSLRHSTTVRKAPNPGISSKLVTTLHHWDGQDIIMESENGRMKGQYVRGAGLIAQIIDLSVFYYLLNAHGDVVQRVSQNGQATPAYKYDAFGNQKDKIDTDPNPFRYCGEYWDEAAGEVYLRARTYNPQNGRFTQEDMAKSGDNWYNYCNGNPIKRVDPSGLDSYVLVDSEMFEDRGISGTVTGIEESLLDTYGPEVHIIYTNDPNFTGVEDWWNGLPDDQIDGVAIVTHGNHAGFYDSNSQPLLKLADIDSLEEKNIDTLILFGCDNGNVDHEDNMANRFTSKIGKDGKVLAIDGRRYYSVFNGHNSIIVPSANTDRAPLGFMVYYANGRSPHPIEKPQWSSTYYQSKRALDEVTQTYTFNGGVTQYGIDTAKAQRPKHHSDWIGKASGSGRWRWA